MPIVLGVSPNVSLIWILEPLHLLFILLAYKLSQSGLPKLRTSPPQLFAPSAGALGVRGDGNLGLGLAGAVHPVMED